MKNHNCQNNKQQAKVYTKCHISTHSQKFMFNLISYRNSMLNYSISLSFALLKHLFLSKLNYFSFNFYLYLFKR